MCPLGWVPLTLLADCLLECCRDLGGKVDGRGREYRVREGNLIWYWVREKD